MEKVVLILVDGMRPDGMLQCGSPYPAQLLEKSLHCLSTATVMPSVTLPCHMSLFHSVAPDRHGILSNTYVPQVRPITGLVDQLDRYGKKCGFFYTWEELRDLTRPDHLHTAVCLNLHKTENADQKITDQAVRYLQSEEPDFLFVYLGETDETGHGHGWMGEEYLRCVAGAWDCIHRIEEALPSGYTLMVCADHGGHDRGHGSTLPEDMTIPLCICGPRFPAGAVEGASIQDIAPTIAALLEVPPVKEWEGTSWLR